jgi:competence protein ComEC
VVFFDVGQGDAALVQGMQHSLLIDSGPGPPDGSGGQRLVRAIRALGLRSIDALVVTHADLDHRGGARRVLDSLSVGELWMPASDRGDATLERLAERARERGARVRWRWADGRVDRFGEMAIRVLWPPAASATAVAESFSRNEGSLVLGVELRDTRFLFTADVGQPTEQALLGSLAALRADILKVSHHGSRRSSGVRLLEAVGARLAVVSAPCLATRGLPSPVVLERLRAVGTAIAWTGRDGAVAIEAGGGREPPRLRRWARPRLCEVGR